MVALTCSFTATIASQIERVSVMAAARKDRSDTGRKPVTELAQALVGMARPPSKEQPFGGHRRSRASLRDAVRRIAMAAQSHSREKGSHQEAQGRATNPSRHRHNRPHAATRRDRQGRGPASCRSSNDSQGNHLGRFAIFRTATALLAFGSSSCATPFRQRRASADDSARHRMVLPSRLTSGLPMGAPIVTRVSAAAVPSAGSAPSDPSAVTRPPRAPLTLRRSNFEPKPVRSGAAATTGPPRSLQTSPHSPPRLAAAGDGYTSLWVGQGSILDGVGGEFVHTQGEIGGGLGTHTRIVSRITNADRFEQSPRRG